MSASSSASIPAARTEDFYERNYKLAQGDSFATISEKYFKSPVYADALKMYNQTHPTATDKAKEGRFGTGDTIIVPDLKVLLAHYQDMIPASKTTGAAPSPVKSAVYTTPGVPPSPN